MLALLAGVPKLDASMIERPIIGPFSADDSSLWRLYELEPLLRVFLLYARVVFAICRLSLVHF